MKQKRARRRDAGRPIAAMGRKADGADDKRQREGARGGLVFDDHHGRAGDGRAQRTESGHQHGRSQFEPGCRGHQNQSPDAQSAARDLFRRQHIAESQAGNVAQGESRLIVERVGDVRLLHQNVDAQHRGIAQMLQHRRPYLRVLL